MNIPLNYALICAITGWVVAQILKTVITSIRDKKLDLRRTILSSGGFPSAHSAAVCALATAIARSEGLKSPLFAAVTIFALLVMYDAIGVRWAAGQHAKVLNHLTHKNTLKEKLGHTPFEVIAGAALGIVIAFVVPYPLG